MSDRDDFVAWTQSRLRDAETALHNGDPGSRLAIWFTREPVSVLGAARSAFGQKAVRDLFRSLGDIFSNCTSHLYEIVAAEVVGDIAYTVGYERTQASINGEPRQYALRSTQVYRREDGEWKSPTDTPIRLRTRRSSASSHDARHPHRGWAEP